MNIKKILNDDEAWKADVGQVSFIKAGLTLQKWVDGTFELAASIFSYVYLTSDVVRNVLMNKFLVGSLLGLDSNSFPLHESCLSCRCSRLRIRTTFPVQFNQVRWGRAKVETHNLRASHCSWLHLLAIILGFCLIYPNQLVTLSATWAEYKETLSCLLN